MLLQLSAAPSKASSVLMWAAVKLCPLNASVKKVQLSYMCLVSDATILLLLLLLLVLIGVDCYTMGAGWPAVSTSVLRGLAGKPGAAKRALHDQFDHEAAESSSDGELSFDHARCS